MQQIITQLLFQLTVLGVGNTLESHIQHSLLGVKLHVVGSIYHCCIINHPKLSGGKKSFYYAHDSVGQKVKQGTVYPSWYPLVPSLGLWLSWLLPCVLWVFVG